MGSKNINYIWDHDRNETIVEDVPMGRKMTIDLTKKCNVNQYHPNKNLENTDAGKNLEVADQSSIPFRSFGSVDELHFAKHGVFRNVLTGERGSACCVHITDPRSSTSTSSNVNDTSHDANNGGRKQEKELWLGISHSKFKFRTKETRYSLPGNVSANHFFSTFYAFDTHEPFAVQAISGRFCLGFPTLNETTTTSTTTGTSASDRDKNPYGRHNKNALRLGADYFDCPAIHFVSGMVEKADDPSRIIIAYGVNDCAPRFVEVEKTEIQQMLFSKRQSYV